MAKPVKCIIQFSTESTYRVFKYHRGSKHLAHAVVWKSRDHFSIIKFTNRGHTRKDYIDKEKFAHDHYMLAKDYGCVK